MSTGNTVTVRLIHCFWLGTYLLRKQAAAAAEDVNRREEAERERESRGRDRGRRKRTILLVSQIRGLAMQRKTIRILVHNAES